MDQTAIRLTLAERFAAGALDPALALLAETMAAVSMEAQAVVQSAEATAGALFEGDAAAPLNASALDAVLARLDAQDAPLIASPNSRFETELMRLPEPLRSAALQAARNGARWTFAAPGLRVLNIEGLGGMKAELLRIQPGHGAPTHTHEGDEYTLVLEGAFHDGHALYGAGDISIATPDLTHRPIAEPGPVCYAFAVSEGDLKFTGALGAVQRLLPG